MADTKKVLVGLAEVLEGVRQHAVIRENRPLMLGDGLIAQISKSIESHRMVFLNFDPGELNHQYGNPESQSPEPPTAEDALKRFK